MTGWWRSDPVGVCVLVILGWTAIRYSVNHPFWLAVYLGWYMCVSIYICIYIYTYIYIHIMHMTMDMLAAISWFVQGLDGWMTALLWFKDSAFRNPQVTLIKFHEQLRSTPVDDFRGGHTYPLVNVYITMENHHATNGKTHYFDWAIFNSKLLVITRGYTIINPIKSH